MSQCSLRGSRRAACLLVLSLVLSTGWAQQAERPIRIIVPFQPGGAGDGAARILADGLAQKSGQPVVVENKAGATGLLGTQAAAAAAPDGHTLFLAHGDTIVLNPLVRKKLPYDASKPFESVAFISRLPGVLVARPGAGIASGNSLIAAARQRPRQVSLATWGLGSSPHLGLELMNQLAGIELLHVPFQGTPAAVAAFLAGTVDLVWVTPEFALNAARDGKAVIVGASSAARLARAPHIPTLAEQGFADVDLDTWYGLMAPPGTPLAIRQRLHGWVNGLLADPEIARRLREGGHQVQPMSIAGFEAHVAREQEQWGALVRDRGLAREID